MISEDDIRSRIDYLSDLKSRSGEKESINITLQIAALREALKQLRYDKDSKERYAGSGNASSRG